MADGRNSPQSSLTFEPPPGVDPEREARDRASFERYQAEQAKDPAFLAEMAKQGQDMRYVIPDSGSRIPGMAPTSLAYDDLVDPTTDHLPQITLKPVKDLPSRGLAYPKNAEIQYRSYMLGEIEQLEESMTEKDRYIHILKGVKANFDLRQLTVPDVVFLGLLRKLSTMGSDEACVDTKCPKCGSVNVSRFLTGNLVFDELQVPALPVNVKLSFGDCQFYPMTIGDWLDMHDAGIPLTRSTIYAVQCRNLPFPDSINKFKTVVNALDLEKLGKLDKLLDHDVAVIKVPCQGQRVEKGGEVGKCGVVYEADIHNSRQAYLYPFRPEDYDLSDQITFG